jgi:flagellar protein FliO/FliZ
MGGDVKNVFIIIAMLVFFVHSAMFLPAQDLTQDGVNEAPARINEEDLIIQDTQSPQVELEGGLNTFTVWDFLRMLLVLGGVIAAIYGIFFLLKRAGNPKSTPNDLILVLSTQNLQGNRSLHLVQVGNEVYLVGSAEGGVRLVSKIEDGESLDRIRLYSSELAAGRGTSFQQALRGLFKKTENSLDANGDSVQGSALFLQKQRERLKNM